MVSINRSTNEYQPVPDLQSLLPPVSFRIPATAESTWCHSDPRLLLFCKLSMFVVLRRAYSAGACETSQT